MTEPTPSPKDIVALLPCPFCGGEAKCFPDEVGSGGQHLPPYYAGCKACRVFFSDDDEVRAITDWNRRSESLRAQPAIEEEGLRSELTNARDAFVAIQDATIAGKVCDDIAWFSDIETLHDFCADQADKIDAVLLRTSAAGSTRDDVLADVVRLVIASRRVAFEDRSPEAIKELDVASEAFADRVLWEDEPESET